MSEQSDKLLKKPSLYIKVSNGSRTKKNKENHELEEISKLVPKNGEYKLVCWSIFDIMIALRAVNGRFSFNNILVCDVNSYFLWQLIEVDSYDVKPVIGLTT